MGVVSGSELFRPSAPPPPVLLALDVGNSAIKGGLFEGEALSRAFRLRTDPTASVAAYRHALRHHLGGASVRRLGLASVVPAVGAAVAEAAHLETMQGPMLVGPRLRLPFALGYRTPETLGADRLAAAAGAWVRFGEEAAGRPLVVVDAGTAVTFEVLEGGAYLGGAIGVGPDLLRLALARGTAQLPEIRPALPRSPIGRSTAEALQAGIALPFLDGVRGMLGRLREALGAEPLVVATGGWGSLLGEHLEAVAHVEPALVLHGVRALAALNP